MKPTGGAARMNMARAGSESSVNSNTSFESTPRADLQTTPVRQNPHRTTNGGVGVSDGKLKLLQGVQCRMVLVVSFCIF